MPRFKEKVSVVTGYGTDCLGALALQYFYKNWLTYNQIFETVMHQNSITMIADSW